MSRSSRLPAPASTSTSALSSMTTLPHELQRVLDAELAEGEHVLWRAQPIARRRLRSKLPTLVIAVPWTTFSVFWVVMASMEGWFALFGVPFVAIGLFMLSAPWVAARNARHSVYVVTNHRLLLIEETIDLQGASLKVASIIPTTITRRQHKDGSGDLVFKRVTTGSGDNQTTEDIGFLDVDDVVAVDKQIRAVFPIAP